MTVKKKLAKQIEAFLQGEFITPFVGSILQDPEVCLRVTNAFVLLPLSERLILEFDAKLIDNDEKVVAVREKTLFLGYLGKVYKSALLLIGTTDYLGGLILFRSVFELLVGIATDMTGGMRDRLSSIEYLDEDEKDCLYTLWNELSAWAHPYRKWEKNVCPILYGTGRKLHPSLLGKCLDYSDRILDLLLTITIEHFRLSPGNYIDRYREISGEDKTLEISTLKMLERRVTGST